MGSSKSVPARRLDPVAIPTDASTSSNSNSFHINSKDAPLLYGDPVVEDTSSNNIRPVRLDQLTRRSLHTYTPTGAASVSVNGTGIKATPYSPS